MRAIGYVRVSTDKQDNSADAQDRKIRATATLRDFDLVEILTDLDEFSGDLNRPGAQRVMELVRANLIDAVIITKLDRLTRSTRDAIELIELFAKHHVAFVSISEELNTESPIGRFVVRLIASIGELEREMIGARTSEGLQNIKAQGFPAGPAPFGWTSQPRTEEEKRLKFRKPLIENPEEMKILARVKELHDMGLPALRKLADNTSVKDPEERKARSDRMWPFIAEILNREGHRTRSGGEWQYQSVHRLFHSVIAKRK